MRQDKDLGADGNPRTFSGGKKMGTWVMPPARRPGGCTSTAFGTAGPERRLVPFRAGDDGSQRPSFPRIFRIRLALFSKLGAQMNHRTGYRCHVEGLEARALFSIGFGAGASDALHGAAAKAATSGPAIRLDLVVLHEIGHALGLAHSSDAASIMYRHYNGSYNLADFANDSAVAAFRALFSSESTRPWKDAR